MVGVAVFSRSLWPEIWGGNELSAKHQNYAFGGALMLGVAVLLLAGLKTLSDARRRSASPHRKRYGSRWH